MESDCLEHCQDWTRAQLKLNALTQAHQQAVQMIEYLLEANLAALPPAMTWTREKPTKEGWYWWRPYCDAQPSIMNLKHMKDQQLYAIQFSGRELFLESIAGDWAGPMELPQ